MSAEEDILISGSAICSSVASGGVIGKSRLGKDSSGVHVCFYDLVTPDATDACPSKVVAVAVAVPILICIDVARWPKRPRWDPPFPVDRPYDPEFCETQYDECKAHAKDARDECQEIWGPDWPPCEAIYDQDMERCKKGYDHCINFE